MPKKIYLALSTFILFTLLLSACGAATQQAAEPQPAATKAMAEVDPFDPAAVSGKIVTAGSSTVFPLAERMAARFMEDGFTGEITIDSIGSGAGFERFCVSGETDVTNASRRIKDSEVESCAAIGRNPIEFRVGTDAIAVVVSESNDFLTHITLEELAMVWSDEATRWSEVNPTWPDEEIRRFSPGTDSGTFDFFIEFVMDDVYGDEGKERMLNSPGTQYSEDDNVLVQGVQGSPFAIAFFGFAYFVENQDILKTVSIDNIEPTAETAESGEYALSRPLYMYSDAGIIQAKPQVAAYLDFVLNYVNEEIESVGYFAASEEALGKAMQAFQTALK